MTKRANGEGTVYRHKASGRWVAEMYLGIDHATNKKIVWRQYAGTRDEAIYALRQTIADRSRGRPVIVSAQTVAEYLDYWLDSVVKVRRRPATVLLYEKMIRLHITPLIGRERLDRLTPQKAQWFLAALPARGLSPGTVSIIHSILKAALAQAEKWEMVTRNVMKMIDPPDTVDTEVEPLTIDEARRLLLSVRSDPLEALYTAAISVGLRSGEARGLRWVDLDLERGTLRVAVQLQYTPGEPGKPGTGVYKLVPPKTRKSRRTIALPDVTVSALKRRKAVQGEEKRQAGSRWIEWGLVFTNKLGMPIGESQFHLLFYAHLKRAGLPRKRFHDLRHTCATLLMAQGIHPRIVMEILGHSGISITMDRYTHVSEALQRVAADSMQQALEG